MEKVETYNLVLEAMPGDFMPVDINLLVKLPQKYDFSKIENIDYFTKAYTEDEIFELIMKNNLVQERYLGGSLKIINSKKYRFKVLTKDDTFDLGVFLHDNLNDKQVMNKFFNIYRKYNGVYMDDINNLYKSGRGEYILSLIYENDYLTLRNIYTSLILASESKKNKIV